MNKIRATESNAILVNELGNLVVVNTGTRIVKEFEADELIIRIIEETKEPVEVDTIVSDLGRVYTQDSVVAAISALKEQGVLRTANIQLSSRSEKQVRFLADMTGSYETAIEIQETVESQRVMVLGVGGIGTWIVNGLYQLGVGDIRVVDPDVVEESNLNRQLFFTSDDVGEKKVEVIKRKLPDTNIEPIQRNVCASADLEGLVDDVDFIFNCADHPTVADTSRWVNEAVKKKAIPYYVSGGYNMHLGMVGPIIVPGKTSCFDCFLAYQKENDPLADMRRIKDVEQSGNLGAVAGVVANLQVLEYLKFISGIGQVNVDRFAEIDFLTYGIEWREFSKREDCITCCD